MDKSELHLNSLIRLLRSPEQGRHYTAEAWAVVLEVGQKYQMLGQLAARLAPLMPMDQLPVAVRRHLALAVLTSRRRGEAALWEIGTIRNALPQSMPVILLKGSAYVAARDANAPGRLFSDIDILIPHSFLDEAEADLFAQGWQPGHVDAYDQKYYREWMHELPPMTHVRRQTVLDLHHSIFPVISRFAFPAELLLRDTIELSPGLYVLSPLDRIIHCAAHAMIEGESSKILRDLYDLFMLLEQHVPAISQKTLLFDRAEELGLAGLILPPVEAASRIFSDVDPFVDQGGLITQWLIEVAIESGESLPFRTRIVRNALLAYSHWAKMPVNILIPHLIRKSFKKYWSKLKLD